MNYASLYNMRSCFTVKRGERRGIPGDPPPLREIRERGRVVASGWTDRDIVKRRRGRWGEEGRGGGRINFAIGEFYVRAAAIYYGGAATGFLCSVSGFNLYPPTYPPLSITDFWLIQFSLCISLNNLCSLRGFIDIDGIVI